MSNEITLEHFMKFNNMYIKFIIAYMWILKLLLEVKSPKQILSGMQRKMNSNFLLMGMQISLIFMKNNIDMSLKFQNKSGVSEP